jgi:hypothetical protein
LYQAVSGHSSFAALEAGRRIKPSQNEWAKQNQFRHPKIPNPLPHTTKYPCLSKSNAQKTNAVDISLDSCIRGSAWGQVSRGRQSDKILVMSAKEHKRRIGLGFYFLAT